MIRLWCCPASANMITGFVSDTVKAYGLPSLPPCWPGGNISCSPGILKDARATQTSGIQCDLGRMQPLKYYSSPTRMGGEYLVPFFVVTSDRVSTSFLDTAFLVTSLVILFNYKQVANRKNVSKEITSHMTASKSSPYGSMLPEISHCGFGTRPHLP